MADILIADHGTVAFFTPMTPEAHQWVEENVQVEPWQRMDASIAAEPRMLSDLIPVMQEAGLIVEPE